MAKKRKTKKAAPRRHPLDVAFGERLRMVREMQRPRVPLQWIARECGCTIQQIQKYENAENRVSFSRICQLADALGIGVIPLIAPILPDQGL